MRVVALMAGLLCGVLSGPLSAQEKEASAGSGSANGTSGESSGANADALARVDGFLVFATNGSEEPAAESKVTLDRETRTMLEGRLRKAFPDWREFHIIGKHTQKVFRQYESWVVPSKDIYLKIDSRGPAEGGGINLHVQLWQDKKVLVKSDPVILPGRPIMVAGPDWRNGRLIFVVMLKD